MSTTTTISLDRDNYPAITASIITTPVGPIYSIRIATDNHSTFLTMHNFGDFTGFCDTHNIDIDAGPLTPTAPERQLIIDKGYWMHPVILIDYNETTTIAELIKKKSEGKLTSETILFKDDPEHPALPVLSWQPKSKHPDGFLVALYDDEDAGPTAVFAVPAGETEETIS